ncbi:hypothetical protein SpAn4DRAFT_0837 [Sporomusa ovata]|uniref:Uncharacterized protein n=1 Tax=Sporomusa ovata TaxID=2378 RepID=A0A0U1L4E1_9FIRM|nr:hypothetical protein SpAn4DRAFT_0837 [Sporomusa ovata]
MPPLYRRGFVTITKGLIMPCADCNIKKCKHTLFLTYYTAI